MKDVVEQLKDHPFILWRSYGHEGWQPEGYSSIQDALEVEKYSCIWIITKNVFYEVKEIE